MNVHKKEAVNILSEALTTIGYPSEALERDFPVPVPIQKVRVNVDLVAFGDSLRKDQQTACITGTWVDSSKAVGKVLEPSLYLASPIAALLSPRETTFYTVHSNAHHIPKPVKIGYDKLERFLRDNLATFEPRTLLKAKTRNHHYLQHSLFDFDPDLLAYALNITGNLLKERVEMAVAEGSRMDRKVLLDEHQVLEATIRLVAAQAVAEKAPNLLESDMRRASVRELLPCVRRLFPHYFPPEAEEVLDYSVLDNMLTTLRCGMSFRALTNEVLSDVYENVFLTPHDKYRKKYGIHYTPTALARQILQCVPLEELPREQRTILDPTCGSGTFLRAAYDRLEQLLPKWYTPSERHEYLSQHILGIDADRVAKEIATVSLILHSLPSGNNWKVKCGYFPQDFDNSLRPSIIVGNPPFGGDAEDGESQVQRMRELRSRSEERASAFLISSLNMLADDGFLAMILPETFLDSSTSAQQRRLLLDKAEIFELWHLPRDVMPMSSASTVVMFVRKIRQTPQFAFPVKVQWTVHREDDREALLQHGRPTFSEVSLAAKEWRDSCVISTLPLGEMWSRLCERGVLSDRASVFSGQPPTGGRFSKRESGPHWRKWLGGQKFLAAFCSNWSEQDRLYAEFPGTFTKPISLGVLNRMSESKVIVSARAIPGGNPWRLYGCVDIAGLVPSNYMHCIVPNEGTETTLEEIAAVVNGTVANAWAYFRGASRSVSPVLVEQVPFPCFDKVQQNQIVELVRRLSELSLFGTHEPEDRRKLFLEIDFILRQAYELSTSECAFLDTLFAGFGPPKEKWMMDTPLPSNEPQRPGGEPVPIVGVVEDLDVTNRRMRIWVSSSDIDDEAVWIAIPTECSGWLLRKESTFSADLLYSKHHEPVLMCIQPLDYGYLNNDELLSGIGD
ncbi:MAG: N-6 DNA methylase [Armatimonadota bacterium]